MSMEKPKTVQTLVKLSSGIEHSHSACMLTENTWGTQNQPARYYQHYLDDVPIQALGAVLANSKNQAAAFANIGGPPVIGASKLHSFKMTLWLTRMDTHWGSARFLSQSPDDARGVSTKKTVFYSDVELKCKYRVSQNGISEQSDLNFNIKYVLNPSS